MEPIETALNGRATSGRFGVGNKFARGNGVARKTSLFRTKMFASTRVSDFAEIVAALVKAAKAGEPWAVKLALEYLVGSSAQADLVARIEQLEAAHGRRQ